MTNYSSPGRRRGLFPHVDTDCGAFRSRREAICTANPALRVSLIPGYTYDFMVRGAHLPALLTRELVSATVAKTQPGQRHAGITLPGDDETSDQTGSEELRSRLAELEAQFSPETLRAFDYEQPPFSPECDISRNVMTTRGLQLVRLDEATELLRLPAGTTVRDPLLPCEGYLCARLDLD